jgi:hypothetical protein
MTIVFIASFPVHAADDKYSPRAAAGKKPTISELQKEIVRLKKEQQQKDALLEEKDRAIKSRESAQSNLVPYSYP